MTAPKVSRPPSRRLKLPSVETQTVEFVETSRNHLKNRNRQSVSRWLEWFGFKVYLRYCEQYPAGEIIFGEILVIASVEVPARLQHRGWFWRYCELCLALIEGGLIIECVVSQELRHSLSMRSDFVEVMPNTFFLKKRGPDHRPELLQSPPLDVSERI